MPDGLRAIAEADLAIVLEDAQYGFGWPIKITDPAGVDLDLVGASSDVAQMIDPDTGQIVTGRLCMVVLRTATLYGAFTVLPEGVTDAAKKPWLVAFNDINGKAYTFKVVQSAPDRELGVLTLTLGQWVPLPE